MYNKNSTAQFAVLCTVSCSRKSQQHLYFGAFVTSKKTKVAMGKMKENGSVAVRWNSSSAQGVCAGLAANDGLLLRSITRILARGVCAIF